MWVYVDGQKTSTPAATVAFAFDGSRAWTLLNNDTISIVGFFGPSKETHVSLDISSFITNSNNIVYGYNVIYVFNNTEFILIDSRTHAFIEKITLPKNINCVPAYGNFKLWFTTLYIDVNSKQQIYYYDLKLRNFSSPTDILGAEQDEPRKIIWVARSVFVTAYNETSVLRYNDLGVYQEQIITNRKPETLVGTQSNTVLVGSFNGLITEIDFSGPTTATNIAGVIDVPTSIFDDGGFIYTVGSKYAITERGTLTDNRREMGGDKDFSINAFSSSSFKQVYITQPYSHYEWDVVNEVIVLKVEPKRVILLGNNGIWFAYNLTDSWDLVDSRETTIDVKATAIIGVGPDVYFGETA